MIARMLKERYALSDTGVRNALLGTVWTAATNLVIMAGMGIMFLAMEGLVAHLADGEPLPALSRFALALAVFAVALFVANWLQYTYTYGVVYEESSAQRIRLAETLRRLPLSFFGRRDLADLTETMLTDVATMEHAYSHVLGELFGALISTAVVAVGCALYNLPLMLAAFWSVPVAFAILYGGLAVVAPAQRRSRAAKVAVADSIQEALDCVREIRASRCEDAYLAKLAAKIDEAEARTATCEVVGGIFMNSAQVVLRLGVPSVVLVAAGQIAAGRIDFMTMFAFLLLVSRIYAPFDQCLMLLFELFASRVAAGRMHQIYDEPQATGTGEFHPQGYDVEFDHVAFSYGAGPDGRAGDRVLEDVSFTAREGEVTALVGPSGSGKSTCARLAARFWDATAGTVTVGGVDVSGVDPEALLRDFSVVFQDVTLFDDTVMENIRLGRRGATDEEVRAAARAAMCESFVSRMPQGFATPIGENGSRLSGGERQRISIARALLKDAPVVLLDEATASLDVESETEVQAALSRLLAGRTVIVIAHRMRTVMAADKVVVLEDGRVAEQGSPAELIARGGRFARMAALQDASAGWSL